MEGRNEPRPNPIPARPVQMKIIKVNRYYCDFCKKANCSAPAMSLHERHCTLNPNRTCCMCKEPRNIPELVKLIPSAEPFHKTTIDHVLDMVLCLVTITQAGETPTRSRWRELKTFAAIARHVFLLCFGNRRCLCTCSISITKKSVRNGFKKRTRKCRNRKNIGRFMDEYF